MNGRNTLLAGAQSLALLGAGVGMVVSNANAQQAREGLVPVGAVAPAWTLADGEGEMHSLESYRGQVVIMDFWATWCGPCKMAMPGMQSLHEDFKDRGVKLFGVNAWESAGPQAALDYMEKEGYTYTTLLEADKVADAYGVRGIPTFYVIGVDGRVIKTVVGYKPDGEDELAEFLEEYLEEHAEQLADAPEGR